MANDDTLDSIFFALSDRTRRRMLQQLAQGDASVSDLAEPFDMSLPAILKHLKVLREAGLITEEKNGRVRRCHFEPKAMHEASDFIATYRRFWENQFDALESYLAEIHGTPDTDPKKSGDRTED